VIKIVRNVEYLLWNIFLGHIRFLLMPQLQMMEPVTERDDLESLREESIARPSLSVVDAPDAMPEVWRVGPYELREQIGQGGMASVYRAWHSGLHRFEALKIPRRGEGGVDGQYIQRLLQEARLAAQLRHPHIVGIHNISEDGAPHPYFSMDLVEGGDLAKLLRERGPLAPDETIAILRQAANALAHAHENGIVHRDIKPENILLQNCEDGGCDVKVVDFGISRAVEDQHGTRLTRNNIFVGTPEYMSPEQSGSGEVVDARTDLYSLGVVAYEMLTGAPPFLAGDGVSRMAVLISHVRDTPRAPREINSEIPEKLSALVMRALEKNPTDRFQSASEMERALAEIADEKMARSITETMPAALAPDIAAPAPPFWRSAQGGWPALFMAVGIGVLIGWLMTARPAQKPVVAARIGSTPDVASAVREPLKKATSTKKVSRETIAAKTISPKTPAPIVRKKQTLKRAIAFSRETRKTASLPFGERKIVQTGRNGVREVVLEIATQGQQEMARKTLINRVISAPKKQIELLGTRAARAKPSVSQTSSSPSSRRRSGSTQSQSASHSRRRATSARAISTKKYTSKKAAPKRSSKKSRSSKGSSSPARGVVPSSQVFGSFRVPGSYGD
jgi:serine/threonine protein kinase